jgi:four helix bundle protein
MEAPMFDHEKLEVYQVLLRFLTWATELNAEMRRHHSAVTREVRGQLDRASLSALLNTAEGNGKRYAGARTKYFDDARSSAMECAACLDALVAQRVCTPARVREGKEMLLRSVQMLTRLVEYWSSPGMVREPPADYQADAP